MIRRRLALPVLGLAIVISACTSSDTSGDSVEASTNGPNALSAAEKVYEQVAPSIASIETDITGGSGILIDASTVLTAAHVVWPYETVRVVFPNGALVQDAPIIGVDLFSDLSIIDVSEASNLPAPVEIEDGETIPPGRPVYLVGYPGESERFPEPTITEGILSRVREWEGGDWTFLQSDTAVGGGQSGGALVDEQGMVIGISNFSFLDEFGLSGSLTDITQVVDRMRSGGDGSGLGDRLPPDTGGARTHQLEFGNFWQEHVFVFEAPLYEEVAFGATSDSDAALTLSTVDGVDVASADETLSGEESIEELISYRGPYVLRVENFSGAGEVRLNSDIDLTLWPDPDDGRRIGPNDTIDGNIDYPRDYDWYRIDLLRGQTVTISVDSIAIDPILMIDGPEGLGDVHATDDDSGGGLFGTNPRIVFTPRESGSFFVIVSDIGSTSPGGYWLSVD